MDKIDSNFEKMPPQNLEAEMAVLGSMLIEETAISYAIEMLTSTSFYNESKHRTQEKPWIKLPRLIW